MESVKVIELLSSGQHLVEVIRVLGVDLLDHRKAVSDDRYLDLADVMGPVRTLVAAESTSMWRLDGSFSHGPSQELAARLARVRASPGLATAKVLEGIYLGAGRLFFENASSVITLSRGHVFPLPMRWLPGVATTPNPTTTHPETLIDTDLHAVLWTSEWAIELDYTFRDRIDQVCAPRWPEQDRADGDAPARAAHHLPSIATIHPWGAADMDRPEEMTAGRFFGVHPKQPRSSSPNGTSSSEPTEDFTVFALLAAAFDAGASVAVLPEFSLQTSSTRSSRAITTRCRT